MRISKYVKVDVNVLLEYIYDDSNYLTNDYSVIIDTLNDNRFFCNDLATTANTNTSQLFSLDTTINKWGIVDVNDQTNRYLFIQHKDFTGNVPFRYDTVKLHFPINYTFTDKLGFLINIGLYNQNQDKIFPISNYYYDKSDSLRTDLSFTTPPFMFQEQLWGKYIQLDIPSPYALINDVIYNNGVRIPRTGTIHKNLVDNDYDVLSNETPIFINFQFLTKKETKLSQVSYLTTSPFGTSIPFTPEYEQLGVVVQPSTQGDYFEIFGTFNDNISEFNSFINNGNKQGKSYYVIYEILTYEKNVLTNTQTQYVFDNFNIPSEYRPIIKYSTTTAIIDVNMKVVNQVDNSTINRTSTYVMLQDEVGKYSVRLTKINVRDTFKPKIYNAKPDQINLSINSNNNTKEIVKVPYGIMYNRANISLKNVSESINDTTYYGIGQQQILLMPSDNIFKFAVATSITNGSISPFQIPTDSQVLLRFKSDTTLVDIPLYYDSGEVNFALGILVFNVYETYYDVLKKMYNDGVNQYYIMLKNSSVSSTMYFGTFLPVNSIK